jgi:CheY-like chemotaxis protein
MDGLELYRKLKGTDTSIKAVILTASQEALDIVNPDEVMVIKKPIFPTKLAEHLKKVLTAHSDDRRVQSKAASF